MGFFFLWISLIKHKMKVTLFFVLIAAIAVLGQGDFDLVERIVLDDFTNGANTHGISITLSADLGVNDPDRTETEMFDAGSGCTGLLGCERDMSLTIFIGLQGRTFSSDIFTTPATYYFDGEWAVSNPKNSESEFILQYDGRDNSFSLDTNGLGNVDLTDNGLDTAYNIIAYSPNGQSCTASIDVLTAGNAYAYDYNDSFVFFNFDNLAGGCDKTNIGAVEVELFSNDALDAILDKLLLLVTQIHLILKHQLHLVLDPQHQLLLTPHLELQPQLLQVLLNVVSSVTVQSSHVTLYMMMMMMKKIFSTFK